MTELGPLERLLRRDRYITAAALVVLSLAAWAYLLGGAGMARPVWPFAAWGGGAEPAASGVPAASQAGNMTGMPGMESPASPGRDILLGVVMWWTMMIAMMAPSAAPMVLLYARVARTSRGDGREGALAHTAWFVLGYLALWLVFSVVATMLQHGLARFAWLSPVDMSVQNSWFDAGVLILAGLYQLSPIQDVCLRHCRTPAAFLAEHYRPGVIGALRLGELHGAYCIGCCWLLMALLFVGGVMNLAWIAALTVLVAVEKMLPGGVWFGRIVGVALIVWGVGSIAAP